MPRTAADPISTTTGQTDTTIEPISKLDVVLEVSQSVLGILKEVSQLSTVPCLQEAATIACTLLQMVQDMKSNKEAYKDIVHEVCTLLACISMQPGEMSDSLKTDLEHLIKDLEAIQKLCLQMAARNGFSRFILSRKDAGDINKIRRQMESTFKVFYFKSTISIRAIQENWSGKESAQGIQPLLAELKEQRKLMEQTGKTIAALKIPASPLPADKISPARPMQEWDGEHVFEGGVENTNECQGSNDVLFVSPMQGFTGKMTFKGKVTNINKVT